jgi:uncharacterized protein (UPF0276 family)
VFEPFFNRTILFEVGDKNFTVCGGQRGKEWSENPIYFHTVGLAIAAQFDLRAKRLQEPS